MINKSAATTMLLTVLLASMSARAEAPPAKPMLDFGLDGYTLSAWIKTTEPGPIFTVGPLDGPWNTGCKCIYVGVNGLTHIAAAGAGHDNGGPAVNDGKWHQIVMPSYQRWHMYIDGKRAFLHVLDGVPDPGSKLNPVRTGPGCVFKIGQGIEDFPNDAPRQFKGQIADVRIYDRILTDEEVAALYGGKTDFPETRLVAHWPLGEDHKDKAGRGHDLRAIGQIAYAEGRNGGRSASFDGTSALWLPLTDRAEGKQGHAIAAPLPEPIKPTYQDAPFGPKLVEDLGFRHLLFVKRDTYHSSHFYSDFIDGCSRFGSNICILDLQTGKETALFSGKMAGGMFGRVDLSFDAKRIVFDWKASQREGFRIYESNIDGTDLRQVTVPPADEELRIRKYDQSAYIEFANIYHHQTDDLDPCYLSDGGIMFVSSRCEYGTLCNSDDQLATTVVYRIQPDGTRMEKLSNNPVSEFTPSVMQDGQVLYTRWEYVDKGQIGVKCLWAMNPDGSASREVYGNNVRFPPTLIQGRQIPGQPDLFVAIGAPHWPHSGTGTVVLIDTTKSIRTLEPMTYVTPYVRVMQEPGYNQYDFEKKLWTRSSNGPLYRDPYPLSDQLFLVSHNEDRTRDAKDPSAYGLYTLDRQARHRRIYRDPKTSLWCAQPLRPRPKPPVVGAQRDPKLAARGLAVCSVMNVHHGMEGVAPGEVKYLRIMEQVPRPWAARRRWEPACGHTQLAGGGGSLSVKLLHGVVPVEEDGSAHFYVPADRNVYFQALDKDYLEIQRERTFVNYRPGETRSCVGCHETTHYAPAGGPATRIAMNKPPVMPQPQPDDKTAARPLHYAVDVQPTLDKYCVRCHGEKDPPAKLRLTGEHTWLSNTSFVNLIRGGYVPGFRESLDFDGTEYMPPRLIGSGASRLMKQIQKGCPGDDRRMSQAEFVRIATWIDTNGVYHGSYWGRIVPPHKDHPNYRPVPTLEQVLGTVNPWEEWTPDWKPPEKPKKK